VKRASSWVRNDLTSKNLVEDVLAKNPETKVVVSDSLPHYDTALQATGKRVAKIYYNRKPKWSNIPQEVVKNTVVISHEGEGAYVYRGLGEKILVEEMGVITAEGLAHLIYRYATSPVVCVYNRLRIIPFDQLIESLRPLVGVVRSTISSVVRNISRLTLSTASSI